MTTTAAFNTKQRSKAPFTPVTPLHRIEGAAAAAAAATLFVLAGFDWWWLLALFLIFDVSMIGYAISNRVGAVGYNLVHNFAAPSLLLAAYSILLAVGIPLWPIALLAGCWFFHVGADRAIGYGPRPPR